MVNFLVFPGMPIGTSIAIFLMIIILAVLLNSFKQYRINNKIQRSTVLVIVSSMLFTICQTISTIIIPRSLCYIRVPLSLGTYYVSRATLYYFFVIRIEITFHKVPGISFSNRLIKILKVSIISLYSICGLMQLILAQYQTMQNNKCTILKTNKLYALYMSINSLYGLTDFVLGFTCIGIFLYRLLVIYKMTQALTVMDNKIDGSAKQANKILLDVIKKQAKLSYVAYITTVIILAIGPAIGFGYFTYIDSIINALCVYCTFEFASKPYNILCNCNGNKYLQYMFCYICGCCCCNQKENRNRNIELKTVTVQPKSKLEETGTVVPSGSQDTKTPIEV